MKKLTYIIPMVTVATALHVLPVQSQVFNIYPSQGFAPTQQSSVATINLETPFRCRTDLIKNQDIISSIKVSADDFKLKQIDVVDDLPRYEVNGFSFEDTPVDQALQILVEEAGIEVFTEDDTYIALSAKDIYGELSLVIDELSNAGETYYQYDAKQKRLYLTRRARFELQMPNNRMLILGVLDALRGAGIENITPNWNTNVLSLTLTKDEEKSVRDLMSHIMKTGEFLVADTHVYAVTPTQNDSNWGTVVNAFGVEKIHATNSGLSGKLLSMSHQKNADNFMETVKRYYTVTPISHGMSVVPNGWKMRFDIGKCATTPYIQNQLSLLLYPNVGKGNAVDMQITLNTTQGELSTFKTNTAIDDELAIVGIADQNGIGSEILAMMKLKLIRLVQEKK